MGRNLQRAAAAAAAGLTLTAGVALAQSPRGSEFSLELHSHQPAASTGLTLRVLYRDPANPDGKPSPIKKVVIEAPAGLRFDGGAVPACKATDEQLRAMGRRACPPESRVGEGTLTAFTGAGAGDPVEADATVFNGGDQLIELISFKGTDSTAGMDRLKIDGSTLTAHPPTTPGGPPDGRTSVREIKLRIEPRESGAGSARRVFITTPPECPAGGTWSSRGTFDFENGTTETIAATTACEPGAGRPAAGDRATRVQVAVSPRLAVSGRRTRFRVRVRSADAGCVAGRGVRIGRSRAVTDGGGRAVLVGTVMRRGRVAVYFARAGAGCRTLPLRIRVRAR